jgi:ferredoxin-NADP reductase
VEYTQLTIKGIQEEVEGFKTFTFADDHSISYKAGQYLTFIHKTRTGEIRRSYSIVSSPLLQEPLSMGVKRIENGVFSRELIDHAKAGDQLLCTGAGGLFVLPEQIDSYKQLFFFAAGSGITPIYSLIKTVLAGYPHLSIVLIYSNHSKHRVIYLTRLRALEEKYAGRFAVEFLHGDSPFLHTARLNRELLVQLMERYLNCGLAETLHYICGPESYMRMCTYALQEEKIPQDNIKKENFIVENKKVLKREPPDKATHKVSIDYSGIHYDFEVSYPDSILKAAQKQDIDLPFSCETGRCGNCLAKCTSGEVWLSYNEVLTDKDIQNGLTLTCVGHPINGDVKLQIG